MDGSHEPVVNSAVVWGPRAWFGETSTPGHGVAPTFAAEKQGGLGTYNPSSEHDVRQMCFSQYFGGARASPVAPGGKVP